MQASSPELLNSPLGKNSSYICQYAPELLFPIPRKTKREEIGVPEPLPFHGFDTWNAYEVSWLNPKGKPVVALLQCNFDCRSACIIESKSFKLYLNSFNNSVFNSFEEVKLHLERDLGKAVSGLPEVLIFTPEALTGQKIESFSGECIDHLDIECKTYQIDSRFLKANNQKKTSETLYSNLLKSNCLVTGQPDWGSVQIKYSGPEIDKAGLLQYLVSFRNHNEFHEQCVERIFMDILKSCKPESLTVEARYTRRGGLDINPVRSTEKIRPAENIRMARQ